LYEAAVFQWLWLQECVQIGRLPAQCDQFNSLQEKLLTAFAMLAPRVPHQMHFASVKESIEDRATVAYLEDLAHQAGIRTRYIVMEDIGRSAEDHYTDCEDQVIDTIFKLYPWEFLFADEYSIYLEASGATWFEPPWKSILSNKGALALLWELHPGHPNLLPTFFEGPGDNTSPLSPNWVRKPLFSREGANIQLLTEAGEYVDTPGPYADSPCVRQQFHPLPRFGENYALIGSWVIGDQPAGLGVREDHSLISRDTARFVPHVIV
jgi:glutathionylspermidine synthase